MVATHFREVAERVTFEGGLLQKWIVDALFRCVEVHIRLIDQPPKGAEAFTETVYKAPAVHLCSRPFRPGTLASNTGTQVTPAETSPS